MGYSEEELLDWKYEMDALIYKPDTVERYQTLKWDKAPPESLYLVIVATAFLLLCAWPPEIRDYTQIFFSVCSMSALILNFYLMLNAMLINDSECRGLFWLFRELLSLWNFEKDDLVLLTWAHAVFSLLVSMLVTLMATRRMSDNFRCFYITNANIEVFLTWCEIRHSLLASLYEDQLRWHLIMSGFRVLYEGIYGLVFLAYVYFELNPEYNPDMFAKLKCAVCALQVVEFSTILRYVTRDEPVTMAPLSPWFRLWTLVYCCLTSAMLTIVCLRPEKPPLPTPSLLTPTDGKVKDTKHLLRSTIRD